jgi:hypothetical protein
MATAIFISSIVIASAIFSLSAKPQKQSDSVDNFLGTMFFVFLVYDIVKLILR